MKRYFFHVRNGPIFFQDLEGSIVKDLEAAIDEAQRSVKEIVADSTASGKPIGGQQFEIVDEAGIVWAIIQFKAFIPHSGAEALEWI
ncbi:MULTISPECIES: DUF6894 family protein [Rhizobium]|uniref:DUF6894 domain-containing protein n=1 Tax=Rhizobium tumorigenes TaxID=2041385 RepID=A0AAF1KPH9_9HYPH|nr:MULTISPECIES: hypothetical protein [Rhizobium]MBO9102465.1 hypothetical protein [Rhizobium sp. L58/93]MBO9172498.1 hypothetical protein [Rhizobium sp. L245/93]MBO9188234.1 hypothetical protein [Rhizobium sp. E27B/91]QXZ87620.1 hypothetical protein J5287_28500 [Rhizobium sp. K1/93]QXZ93661.1 hypothetical protein J5280_28500 [Rhizobium sp. K15/93]